MPALIASRFLVRGRVQGVGFRWHVVEAARRAGVTGWVRNLPDGRVEALVEGEPAAVLQVEAALRTGPGGARVTYVDALAEEPAGGHASFQVTQ